jgi:molybdopterin-guanine dinucleotide biosynthesis protein A
VIPDDQRDLGPLSGIIAALERTEFEWNVFLAVDVPFVPREAWVRLLAAAEVSDAVCVMARVDGHPQPLCAVYRRKAAPTLRAELQAGRLKVATAVAVAGAVEYVDFENVGWFRNFNTPLEFEEVALLTKA